MIYISYIYMNLRSVADAFPQFLSALLKVVLCILVVFGT